MQALVELVGLGLVLAGELGKLLIRFSKTFENSTAVVLGLGRLELVLAVGLF